MKKILKKIDNHFLRLFYPIISYKLNKFHIINVNNTVSSLINTNKSLARFGDGEIRWLLKCNSNSFEKNSELLSNKLLQVLQSKDPNLEIGLPGRFKTCKPFSKRSNDYWKLMLVKYGLKFAKYLNVNKIYYNTDVTRPYIDYKNKDKKLMSSKFNYLKKIWCNKNILIVEGIDTRLGVGNNLFTNTKDIKRIECPSINAFESYNKIFNVVNNFLNNNKDDHYLTLIALGPTATVLAYNLMKHGHRAIDIGHIDVEYEWFLMGAKDVINIPSRYVNEAGSRNITIPIHNDRYEKQILYVIK